MILGPLLLSFGVMPDVTAATSSFMIVQSISVLLYADLDAIAAIYFDGLYCAVCNFEAYDLVVRTAAADSGLYCFLYGTSASPFLFMQLTIADFSVVVGETL